MMCFHEEDQYIKLCLHMQGSKECYWLILYLTPNLKYLRTIFSFEAGKIHTLLCQIHVIMFVLVREITISKDFLEFSIQKMSEKTRENHIARFILVSS